MIKQTIVLFIVLSCTYSIFISRSPAIRATQDQTQSNYAKAEYYLYNNEQPIAVIGTSLAARLVMDSLPNVYNLAFSGMSLSDGLLIIQNKPELPKTILIETNFFWKKESTAFIDNLFNPVNFYLKKEVPAFRSDRQLISIISNYLIIEIKKFKRYLVGNSVPEFGSIPTESLIVKPSLIPTSTTSLPNFPGKRSFNDIIDEYVPLLEDSSEVEIRIIQIEEKINYLKSKGVKIIFFEMPMHPKIMNEYRFRYFNEKFTKLFPKKNYFYIPYKDWNFQTTDGVHLSGKEASIFTGYLAKFQNL